MTDQDRDADAIHAARAEIEAIAGPAFDHFPGYTVLDEAHRGGQGVVYRARDLATDRTVAIKVMLEGPLASPEERARFEREMRVLAQLNHPNIVTIHHTSAPGQDPYFVMDYIDGLPLDRHAAVHGGALRDILAMFAKVCEAVNAAHVRGVIHRDLKPGNIRVDRSGEPFVLDFGLAKLDAGRTDASLHTVTGQFVGSLPWAAPEQLGGDGSRVDTRTDVYALGVVLYQVLTARFPYDVTGNFVDVVDRIRTAEPTPARSVRREIDADVETILRKCLHKDRERRYQTAGELARDLEHYLAGEPIEARRDSALYVLKKMMMRYRVPTAAAAVLLFSGYGFGATMTGLYQQAQGEAKRASEEVERMKEPYTRLLEKIAGNRIDPVTDSFSTMLRKRDNVRRELEGFANQTVEFMVDDRLLGRDYARFACDTMPRLTGRLLRVGQGQAHTTLEAAAEQMEPGDTILLGQGTYKLPPRRSWRDVAFVGQGREQTVLHLQLETATRVRIAGVHIDCQNNEFLDLRNGGSVQIRDCLIDNYNSGAGGSNAVFASGSVLLVEGCVFEGRSGRMAKRDHGGRVFDLRGTNVLYARATRFVDNSEVVRASNLCVFDDCESLNRLRSDFGIMPYRGGRVLLRKNRVTVHKGDGPEPIEFSTSSDDAAVAQELRGVGRAGKSEILAGLEALHLDRDPRYWAVLLMHAEQEVRFLASGRLAALLRGLLPKPPKPPQPPKVAEKLPAPVEELRTHGVRAATVLRWLDYNARDLSWDAKAGCYKLERR